MGKGWPLFELRGVNLSLEDIFLQLTTEDAPHSERKRQLRRQTEEREMKGLYAVYRKEMGHYFVSPVAYVIVGVFLILSAYFFNRLLIVLIQESLEAGRTGAGVRRDLPRLTCRRWWCGTFSVFCRRCCCS